MVSNHTKRFMKDTWHTIFDMYKEKGQTGYVSLVNHAVVILGARLLKKIEEIQTSNLADAYRGTFQPNTDYERGQVLTHDGGLWLCMEDTTKKPGNTAAWRLILRGSKS